jgi:hypothetical protein
MTMERDAVRKERRGRRLSLEGPDGLHACSSAATGVRVVGAEEGSEGGEGVAMPITVEAQKMKSYIWALRDQR